ncbi:MAG: helix-turn-helix domain-containing protein [Mesorhizobium sp.]|nr:helix-turn-helix domain-containing protein [Mesorhizobium sp.]MBN9243952.1 helix-turn-helix domain-containing protein [Mesorhizobium sp.]
MVEGTAVSWQATAWVSKVEAGGASGKLLLYALANYADETGRCWPSDARLMSDTEMAERTIRDWKRKLEDAGLIVVERRRNAGGTYQADEIRLCMDGEKQPARNGQPPANPAGGATGISRHSHRQMTAQPPADDSNPPAPPYKAEPSVEPPTEPIEREAQARGSEDRKAVERAFERAWRDWPVGSTGSRDEAFAAWSALTPDQRTAAKAAIGRWIAANKASGRDYLPALSRYLAERRWEGLPELVEDKPAFVDAPVFGPVWSGVRMELLLTHVPVDGPKPSAFLAEQLARDDEAGRQARLTRQATYGWPAVNRIHERAADRAGISVGFERAERLKPLMEPVPVGSDVYASWRGLHERMGWPWLPDPGKQPVVFFPVGGPERLSEFETVVRGTENDGGRCEAAE